MYSPFLHASTLATGFRPPYGSRHERATQAQDPPRRGRDADPLVQPRRRPALAAAAGAAPRHPAAGRPGRPGSAVPDGADHAGGHQRAPTSRSPTTCSTSTGCGGRPRCIGRTAWSARSDTPARIYYKYEGVSPAGSHKPNTAVPQAFYNAEAGIRRLTTETGAGQWGTALAFACAQFGLECEIWQVRASYDQKPYRRMMIETFGATVHPSPSDLTNAGRRDPGRQARTRPASLGIAISEAVEVAAQNAGHELRTGQRAEPRADAPDDHRRGSAAAAGEGRRDARPDRRLHRRRIELRRPRVPVPAREAGRADVAADPSRWSRPPARP
ncbi:MAG: pyridoxal-phosphate dependent enzyme [Geodermatophilaceae bacterium]